MVRRLESWVEVGVWCTNMQCVSCHCSGPHSRRMATSERQQLLQEQYYFLCQCAACGVQSEPLEQRSDLLCERCRGHVEVFVLNSLALLLRVSNSV